MNFNPWLFSRFDFFKYLAMLTLGNTKSVFDVSKRRIFVDNGKVTVKVFVEVMQNVVKAVGIGIVNLLNKRCFG